MLNNLGGIKLKSYFLFLAFMLMVTTYLPIVSAYSRFNLGVNMTWVIIWFISVFFIVPRAFADRLFLYVFFFWFFFVFILWNTLWVDVRKWDKDMDNNAIIGLLVPISLYTYFRFSRDYDGLALLVKWTLLFITITAILSIYSSFVDPMYARSIISGAYTAAEANSIQKLGGGWYGYAGTLVMLFPMMIYYYRHDSKTRVSKLQILLFGVLCFAALLRMQIFANIILAVFAIIVSLLGTKRIRKTLIFILVFFFLMVIIPTKVYTNLLINSSSFFDSDSEMYNKLNDMALYIEFGEVVTSGAGGRVDRYPLLWEGFKANPITGFYNSGSSLDIEPGGHLYWMNKLTVYGILGFIPFILIFYFYINKVLKHFDSEFSFYFLVSVFAGIGLGFIKSLFGQEFWTMFFFILPGLYYLPRRKKSHPVSENEMIFVQKNHKS